MCAARDPPSTREKPGVLHSHLLCLKAVTGPSVFEIHRCTSKVPWRPQTAHHQESNTALIRFWRPLEGHWDIPSMRRQGSKAQGLSPQPLNEAPVARAKLHRPAVLKPWRTDLQKKLPLGLRSGVGQAPEGWYGAGMEEATCAGGGISGQDCAGL